MKKCTKAWKKGEKNKRGEALSHFEFTNRDGNSDIEERDG